MEKSLQVEIVARCFRLDVKIITLAAHREAHEPVGTLDGSMMRKNFFIRFECTCKTFINIHLCICYSARRGETEYFEFVT